MNRRKLVTGSLAAMALTALPLQLPAAASRKPHRDTAVRRYRKLRRLLRHHPIAGPINILLAPAKQPGGYLRLQTVPLRRRMSWLATTHAQDYVLEPIQVIAPLSFDAYVASSGVNFSSQNAYSRLLQYNSYVTYYLPMIAAQNAAAEEAARQAALVNVIVIPPVVEPAPEPGPEPTLDEPLLNNPYAQYVASALQEGGLYLAEAMAVAFFIEGAATVLEFALPPLVSTASQLVAEGLAAGTITARIGLMGAGLTVSLTGVGLAVFSVALVVITLNYVVPEIERQLRANVSDFTVEIYAEAIPLAAQPDLPLEPFVTEPWWWDEETQTWVHLGG